MDQQRDQADVSRRRLEGLQEEKTTLYRYDSAEHLDAWLTSPQRQKVLAEGEKFSDFKLHTIDNSFGSWFAFEGNGKEAAPPPSETRTSLAVWAGLYPTVVLAVVLCLVMEQFWTLP